jgi:hypothetical protein
MTEVAGSAKQVGQGLTQTTFSYAALGKLVDIVTNTAGKLTVTFRLSVATNKRLRPSRVSSRAEDDRRRFRHRWIYHRSTFWNTVSYPQAGVASCQFGETYNNHSPLILVC